MRSSSASQSRSLAPVPIEARRNCSRRSRGSPVQAEPGCAADVAAVDSSVAGEGADDGEAVAASVVAGRLGPVSATVFYLDPYVVAFGAEGEVAAAPTSAAVLDGVGCEFGGAQDRIVG